MPNVRLRLANGEPLFIPAHAFRFMESAGAELRQTSPEAEGVLLYDLGGRDGVQTVQIKTKPAVVAELVQSDPKFRGRVLEFEAALGSRIWTLPSLIDAVAGHKPPTADELSEIEAQVEAAEQAVGELDDADASQGAMLARQRVLELRGSLEGRKSFQHVRARLDALIPDRKVKAAEGDLAPPGMRLTYWLLQSADEVLEALDPAPKAAPRPPAAATPVREKSRRRRLAAA